MVKFSVIALLLGSLYFPLFPDLWHVWSQDPNYGHGAFVPILSCFILWRKRKELFAQEPVPFGPGLTVFLLGILLYLIGLAGNEAYTTRSSMIVVALGITLTLWGRGRTKTVLFPVLFLLLMIPLPYVIFYAIASPMKLFATKGAVFAMDLFRMSVYHEGNIIHLPNASLEVENACSGLRSLMALFTFGLVFAYVAQKSVLLRGVLIGAIFPIAIVSNIIRIIATSLLAYYKGPETATSFLHDTSGVVVYTVATVLLISVNELIRMLHRGQPPAMPKAFCL